MMPIRYIRDWANGSTVNAYSHWVEIQAVTLDGVNIALSCHVVGSTGATYPIITNGNSSSAEYVDAPLWVKVDLGAVYRTIDTITVWHYYTGGRTYHGTKTEVSADGVTWTALFDSAVSGEYAETAAGHAVTVPPDSVMMRHIDGYFMPSRNPARPQITPRPEQATARTAGGVVYGYAPVVTDELITLEWNGMSSSDVASLQTLFATVGGMAEDFTLYDPWAQTSYTVAFAEPRLSITETAYDRHRVACTLRRTL